MAKNSLFPTIMGYDKDGFAIIVNNDVFDPNYIPTGGSGTYTPPSMQLNEYQKNLVALINRGVTNNLQNASLTNPSEIENRFRVKTNATLRSTPTSAVKTNILKTYPSNTTIVYGVQQGKSTNVSDPYLWYSVVEDITGVNGFMRIDQVVKIMEGETPISEAIEDSAPSDTSMPQFGTGNTALTPPSKDTALTTTPTTYTKPIAIGLLVIGGILIFKSIMK